MAGDSDVKFKANITQGFEIARLVNETAEYLVPLGSNNIQVHVFVKIPKNTKVGTEYQGKIEFNPAPSDIEEEGMVQIAVGLSGYFKVKVIEKPIESESKKINLVWIIMIIVLALGIIVVIWFLIKGKGKIS